jgi:hypothetical protein
MDATPITLGQELAMFSQLNHGIAALKTPCLIRNCTRKEIRSLNRINATKGYDLKK